MTTRFISQDLEWTESMKETVRSKIVEPLQRHLDQDNFEVSVHLAEERKRMNGRKPKFEMWVVLQTFDGRGNQIVRREGHDFAVLTNEVSNCMRAQLNKHKFRRRFTDRSLKVLNSVGGSL